MEKKIFQDYVSYFFPDGKFSFFRLLAVCVICSIPYTFYAILSFSGQCLTNGLQCLIPSVEKINYLTISLLIIPMFPVVMVFYSFLLAFLEKKTRIESTKLFVIFTFSIITFAFVFYGILNGMKLDSIIFFIFSMALLILFIIFASK